MRTCTIEGKWKKSSKIMFRCKKLPLRLFHINPFVPNGEVVMEGHRAAGMIVRAQYFPPLCGNWKAEIPLWTLLNWLNALFRREIICKLYLLMVKKLKDRNRNLTGLRRLSKLRLAQRNTWYILYIAHKCCAASWVQFDYLSLRFS